MRPAAGRSSFTASAGPEATGAAVACVEADDAKEFRETYTRLHDRLVTQAERLLGREEARDAVAQTCAELWYRWPQLTPEQRSDRYFFGAVQHTAIDLLKAQTPLVSLDEVEEQLERKVEREVELPTRADTAADILDLTLAAMPPRRRAVFQLIREEEFSYADAAAELGLSLGSIRTHYRLATAEIRAALRQARIRVADPKAAGPRAGGDTP